MKKRVTLFYTIEIEDELDPQEFVSPNWPKVGNLEAICGGVLPAAIEIVTPSTCATYRNTCDTEPYHSTCFTYASTFNFPDTHT